MAGWVGSDPLLADTDEDGLYDGQEMGHDADPTDDDTDADGLTDFDELRVYGTARPMRTRTATVSKTATSSANTAQPCRHRHR